MRIPSLALITFCAATAFGQGIITTIAGSGFGGCSFSGDNGPATAATMCNPQDPAVDAAGNIYFYDWVNFRIRKVAANGIITTIAGNGIRGISGDGGPALAASFGDVRQIAFDGQDRLCFGDNDARKIRCVSLSTGIVTGYGTGIAMVAGDGGLVTNASFYNIWGVAFVPRPGGGPADLYLTEWVSNLVRKIDFVTGIITLAAGNTGNSNVGDGPLSIQPPRRVRCSFTRRVLRRW